MTMARAARRQLLRDRFAEYLTDHGADPDHAAAYAKDLQAIVDELGFALPAVFEDAPPLFDGQADPDHRKACMAEIRAVFAANRAARTAGSAPILDQTQPTGHTR